MREQQRAAAFGQRTGFASRLFPFGRESGVCLGDARRGIVGRSDCRPPDDSYGDVGESDAAQAHYASFVKENTAFWRGVTNQALCLLMLELIAIDQKIALKGE